MVIKVKLLVICVYVAAVLSAILGVFALGVARRYILGDSVFGIFLMFLGGYYEAKSEKAHDFSRGMKAFFGW